MAISEFVIGRLDSRSAFLRGKPFVVAAYRTKQGKTFFTGPNTLAPWGHKPSVVYRINVKPKKARWQR